MIPTLQNSRMPRSTDQHTVSQFLNSTEFEEKIDALIQDSVKSAIQNCMADIFKQIETKFEELFAKKNEEIENLKSSLSNLTLKVEQDKTIITELNEKMDALEQYSRRNCLLITGVPPTDNENTDSSVIEIARVMNSKLNSPMDITLKDIDRSHRIGEKIIVKFSSYNVRRSFYSNRKLADKGIFINESLTKKRNTVLYECRKLRREHKLESAWSVDGDIKIKLPNGSIHKIVNIDDVNKLLS